MRQPEQCGWTVGESTEEAGLGLLHCLPWHTLDFQEQDVSEVLPAIDLQAFSASRPQNYWFLELKGPLDTTQLKRASLELVERHSILRTLFVLQSEKTLQVVLRHLNLGIIKLETDEPDLMAFAVDYSKRDSSSQRLYDHLPLRLTLVQRQPEHHVLIVRLSHAQYDGTSINIFMKELMELYQKLDIGTAMSFGEYTRYRLRSYTEEALAYWRLLLQDASMTVLSTRLVTSNLARSQASLVEVTTSMQRLTPPSGITDATVVKTAWALAHARILPKQKDLVFGYLVSARNGDSALESVVGPCLNLLPARVKLADSEDTESVAALMRRVQDQHAASVDFETLPLSVVAARCTPWDAAIEFGSIVHHRHAPDQSHTRFGELDAYVDAWSPVSLPGQSIWLSSIVDDAGRLHLDMYSSSETASKEELEQLLGALCGIFAALEQGFDTLVTELL